MTTGERQGLNDEEQEARIAGIGSQLPMHDAGSVYDIANAILFLASNAETSATFLRG
jgi:hypothetical protein